MKKTLLVLALLALPLIVGAHEVKKAGSLDILLHMEPLDNPAVGENAQLLFSVADANNKFIFSDCECRVTVKNSSGKELLNRLATIDDLAPDWGINVISIRYVFPQIGIYKVALEGKTKTGLFENFSLEYDKRIERVDESQSLVKTEEPAPWYKSYYAIGGAIIIFGIIVNELISKLKKQK